MTPLAYRSEREDRLPREPGEHGKHDRHREHREPRESDVRQVADGHAVVPDVHDLFGRRQGPAEALAQDAGVVADTCLAIARRLHGGGTLYAFGSGAGATDAQHVVVEFVHPVIVGKRALPALGLTSDVPSLTALAADGGYASAFARQLADLAGPGDVALGIAGAGDCPEVRAGLRVASELGALTVAMVDARTAAAVGAAADHVLTARTDDPRVAKELRVTTYHVLWELVHVFLEAPDTLASPDAAALAGVARAGV